MVVAVVAVAAVGWCICSWMHQRLLGCEQRWQNRVGCRVREWLCVQELFVRLLAVIWCVAQAAGNVCACLLGVAIV